MQFLYKKSNKNRSDDFLGIFSNRGKKEEKSVKESEEADSDQKKNFL